MSAHFKVFRDHIHDSVEIHYGNKLIASTNHDDHGWGGMELAEDIVKNIANALDIRIEEAE